MTNNGKDFYPASDVFPRRKRWLLHRETVSSGGENYELSVLTKGTKGLTGVVSYI